MDASAKRIGQVDSLFEQFIAWRAALGKLANSFDEDFVGHHLLMANKRFSHLGFGRCGHGSGSFAVCNDLKHIYRMVHKNEPVNGGGS